MTNRFYIFAFLINGLLVGLGMGVPFFNILMGIPYGLLVAYRLSKQRPGDNDPAAVHVRFIKSAAILSLTTLIYMLIIWMPWLLRSFEPGFVYKEVGMPFILYEPKASFWGWMVLMIIISPILQFMTSLSSSVIALSIFSKTDK